jgi:hypothetical protein
MELCPGGRAKRWGNCSVEEFGREYKAANLTYNAGVWLKKLCIVRGRMDLLDIILGEPGVVRTPVTVEPPLLEKPPWETFQERTLANRREAALYSDNSAALRMGAILGQMLVRS